MLLAKLLAPLALTLTLLLNPVQFEYDGQLQSGNKAHITIIANEDLSPFTVTIEGDGKTIRKKVPGLRAGSRKKITWSQSSKVASYNLSIESEELTASFPFKIAKAVGKAGKIGNLVVLSDRDEIVKGHKVRYRAPSPLSSYEFKVYDTQGNVIAEDLVTKEISKGEIFEVAWSTDEEVFLIYVKAENDFGGFVEYKLVPWSVEIPHTEIHFDSGKYDIKSDEEWKVSEALAVAFHELIGLDKVNKAVGANIVPRLYIVGYTDTVGNAAKNQVLSENRARAIAKYFHDKGFWAEIYYAGMGERGLRVPTADNVDEVRNRRALYLLTVQQPAAGGQIPGRWKKLAGARPMPAGFTPPPYPERYLEHKKQREAEKAGAPAADGAGDDEPLPSETPIPQDPSSDSGEPSGRGDAAGPPPVDGQGPGAHDRAAP